MDLGLPSLPAMPGPEYRGPTPWSNWVIRPRLIAGATGGDVWAVGARCIGEIPSRLLLEVILLINGPPLPF